jgi:hypothetical protein
MILQKLAPTLKVAVPFLIVLTARNSLVAAAVDQTGSPQDKAEALPSIELSKKQLTSVKTGQIVEHVFPIEKQAVGSIDFNEELLTQVFTPYQGRIIKAFPSAGDEVKKDPGPCASRIYAHCGSWRS